MRPIVAGDELLFAHVCEGQKQPSGAQYTQFQGCFFSALGFLDLNFAISGKVPAALVACQMDLATKGGPPLVMGVLLL